MATVRFPSRDARRRGPWLTALTALAALLILSPTNSAAASEQCQQLLAKGLVEYHAERFSAALPLFEQAVAADGANYEALYYRGVTHGQLEHFPAAIADLRAVLAAQSDHPHAHLDLGIALVQNGDADEAIEHLEIAARRPDQKAQALFFLGLAELRRKNFSEARRHLAAANQADPSLALPARYYMGVAAYQSGDRKQAEEDLTFVVSTGPQSQMGKEARTLLDKLSQAGSGQRSNRLVYVDLGFQYDSNVTLEPSGGSAVGSGEADGRAIISAGALYAPWRTEHLEFSVGYDFFQSVHFDLSDFNLQNHRPLLQLVVNAGPVRGGFLAQYDYYFLGGDPFLSEPSGLAWVQVPEGTFGRTEADYRFRYRDYMALPYDAAGLRDNYDHVAGIRQFIYLGAPERNLWAGYRFQRENAVHGIGDQFSYDGLEAALGIGWALPYSISSDVSYRYRHEEYDPASHNRHDNEHRVVVAAQKILTEHLLVTLAYLGTFNESNQSTYEYDRHIVSLTLGARF